MGLIKPIDVANVKDREYDVLTALAVNGEYIEEIGEACENPAGYTQGSIFLARNDVVMHLYKATANITAGQAMTIGTNCELSSLDAMFKKSGQDLDSVKQALANEVSARAELGAHNKLSTPYYRASGYQRNGITYTYGSDGIINADGTLTTGQTSSYISLRDFSESSNDALFELISSTPYKLAFDGGVSGITIVAEYYNGSTYISRQSGNNLLLTPPSGANKVSFYVSITVNLDNVKIKPYLCLASDAAGFEPYAMTNRELTDAVLISDITSNISISTSSPVTAIDQYSSVVKMGKLVVCNMKLTFGAIAAGNVEFLEGFPLGLKTVTYASLIKDVASGYEEIPIYITNGKMYKITPSNVHTAGDYVLNFCYLAQ